MERDYRGKISFNVDAYTSEKREALWRRIGND
jgi:hypothetical protein